MITERELWLQDSWSLLMERLGALDHQDDVLMDIVNQYKTPDRYYHNLDHIADCLVVLASVRHLADDADAVALAIWFHDLVYDVYSSENEFNSAQIAHANILKLGLSSTLADRVRRLIMATTHREMCSENDEKLLVDIDLVSLGAAPEVFERNTCNIRKEFHNLTDAEYDAAREKMFRSFLERPSIYQTAEFKENLETQARVNLLNSIKDTKAVA